jgi:exo-beta-1,3-glucanase (GH17 family)
MTARTLLAPLAILAIALALSVAGVLRVARAAGGRRAPAFSVRAFDVTVGGRWRGEAIAYGPHRDGQRPGGERPTRAQVREDLAILSKHWGVVRVYDATGTGDTVLAAIRDSRLGTKVVLGLWLAAEDRRDSTGRVLETFPAALEANRREVDHAVRLAEQFAGTVAAITVGNETQVFWSGNRLPLDRLVGYLREVRSRTRVPVSTADDYNFWNKPESRAVAAECDFVFTHLHPLWNGTSLEGAVPWVETQLAAIRALHPDREVVIGETGWATQRNDEGDQGRLMKGALGEAEQAAFVRALRAWIAGAHVPTFTFEAFDENWKGGPDANDVEKHWGLYRADRSPKPAVAELGS